MGVVRHLVKKGRNQGIWHFLQGHVHIPRKSGDTKIPIPVTILYPFLHNEIVINL